jgi:hypothetical protein
MAAVGISLTWAHLVIAGLAADVAGAVALGLAFATKRPEAIRTEVPKTVAGVGLMPEYVSVRFPQQLAYSLVRQRSEARLGLVLLVGGFLLQAAGPFFRLGSLTTTAERWAAVAVSSRSGCLR